MDEFKYQLVLQLRGESEEDYRELAHIEDAVTNALMETPHQVDGHDFGSGTMNIFIDTNDPVAAFGIVKQSVHIDHRDFRVAYRAFEDDEYSLIWPENTEQEFDLM